MLLIYEYVSYEHYKKENWSIVLALSDTLFKKIKKEINSKCNCCTLACIKHKIKRIVLALSLTSALTVK